MCMWKWQTHQNWCDKHFKMSYITQHCVEQVKRKFATCVTYIATVENCFKKWVIIMSDTCLHMQCTNDHTTKHMHRYCYYN